MARRVELVVVGVCAAFCARVAAAAPRRGPHLYGGGRHVRRRAFAFVPFCPSSSSPDTRPLFSSSGVVSSRPTRRRFLSTTALLARRPEIVEESRDFEAAAAHFVDAFWSEKTSHGLSREQQRRLLREQIDEFQRRYKKRTSSSSRRKAAFFVARDASTGETLGCAGVEVEGTFAFDENAAVQLGVPLMSNLAVAKAGRRRGLAKALVKACERQAREWGLNALALVVEERNANARSLYAKLGYRVVDRDDAASTLTPLDDGRIVTTATTTLTMRRNLLLPPLPVSLPVVAAVVLATATALALTAVASSSSSSSLGVLDLSSATSSTDFMGALKDETPADVLFHILHFVAGQPASF